MVRHFDPDSGGVLTGLSVVHGLVRAGDGSWTLRDESIGETYHPELGIRNECRAWLDQPEIRAVLAGSEPLRVWDVGLGAGGVAAALCACLRGKQTHLLSFDRSTAALARVVAEREKFPHLDVLPDAVWRARLGEGTLVWESLRWDLLVGDIRETLPRAAGEPPQLLMYDMHSPQAQPELWVLSFWRHLADLFAGQRVLAAFHTRSTAVRCTLLLAGWWVGCGTALGSKEETTLAASAPGMLRAPLDRRWLQRVRRSTTGHPLVEGLSGPAPITEEWFEELQRHPQFGAE
jgi:hypothetical protein